MRILIIFFLLFSLFLSGHSADNLIINGGFDNGTLHQWISNQQGGGKVKLFAICNDAKSGSFALKCNGDQKNKYNGFITLAQVINAKVLPTKQYQLQGFVKSNVKPSAVKSVSLAVRQVNAKGGSITYTKIPIDFSKKDWQYYVKQFQPAKDAVQLQIYLILSKLSSEDKVYFDNLSLKLLDDSSKKFIPGKSGPDRDKIKLGADPLVLEVDRKSGLMCKLFTRGLVIHPDTQNVSCVFLQKDGDEVLFSRNADDEITLRDANIQAILSPNNGKLPFQAMVKYSFDRGAISERVSFVAADDIDYPVKLGIRHGINAKDWKRVFCALRPLRIISGSQPTIFSYGHRAEDLNLSRLDQYQRTVYPFTILENKDFFLLVGSRNLDRFVTISPNYPEGYIPSVQQNPKRVSKGQKFEFELTWKLFSKKENLLRDVWRWYSENLYSENPLIKNYLPYKPHSFRTFFPGCFASSPYFMKSREDRLFPGSNVWFFAWHDWINENYPTKGSWWTGGNSWKFKMTADRVKADTDRLQQNHHNLIFYFRQIANLRLKGNKIPNEWYRRNTGGSLDLYGGGYKVKLPENVAKDLGYNTLPWGTYDFDYPAFRNHYLQEVKAAVNFYNPKAVGWDMGWHPNHMGMFAVQAEIFNWLRRQHPDKKVVSNESSGPTQFYSDMVLLENGLLGGKSKYDFEISKGQNTTMVCLERWNLFRLAVKANLQGSKTWLSSAGIAANKRYLDYLLKKRPELKSNINEAARLCQLRMSMYDLAFGASPGYLEEAKPVPPALVKMSGEANGLPLVTKSFAVKLPGGSDTDTDMAASAWINGNKFRVVIFNDSPLARDTSLRLSRKLVAGKGWDLQSLRKNTQFTVSPEKQIKQKVFSLESTPDDLVFKGKLPAFAAVMIFDDK